MWSGQIIEGYQALKALPAKQVAVVKYENILQDPIIALRKLTDFIAPAATNEAWLKTVATQVRPARSSWQGLPLLERKALERACAPGFEALGNLY